MILLYRFEGCLASAEDWARDSLELRGGTVCAFMNVEKVVHDNTVPLQSIVPSESWTGVHIVLTVVLRQ